MNKANIILGVGVVVALVLGVWAVTKTPSQNTVREVVREVGAIPGNSIDGPEFCRNGNCSYEINIPLTSATNTPVSFKNPYATSSIEYLSLNIYTGSTTKATEFFEVATSTVAGATTTQNTSLIRGLIASTKGGVWVYTTPTTTAAADSLYTDGLRESTTIKPGEWLILRIASTAPYTYQGVLRATFRKL